MKKNVLWRKPYCFVLLVKLDYNISYFYSFDDSVVSAVFGRSRRVKSCYFPALFQEIKVRLYVRRGSPTYTCKSGHVTFWHVLHVDSAFWRFILIELCIKSSTWTIFYYDTRLYRRQAGVLLEIKVVGMQYLERSFFVPNNRHFEYNFIVEQF